MSLIITQGPTSRIVLPDSPGFALNPVRMEAARTALAGNVIRQISVLHASSATGTWTNLVTPETAATLDAMYLASSAVTIYFKNKTYDAVFTPSFTPAKGRQIYASIMISIVREIQ